jgi:competence protein ComEC
MVYLFTLGLLCSLLFFQSLAKLPFGENGYVAWVVMLIAVLWGVACHFGLRRHPQFSTVIGLGWIFVGAGFGLGYADWRAELMLSDNLPTEWELRDVDIVGYVSALPQRLTDTHRPGWRFDFVVEQTITPLAVIPSHLRLAWYGDLPLQTREAPIPAINIHSTDNEEVAEERSPQEVFLKPGQRWQLKVRLKRPHGNANPGGFDYEAWLFAHNIRATGYVRGPNTPSSPRYLGEISWKFLVWMEQHRAQIRQIFASQLPAQEYPQIGILIGLAIGDQGAISPEQWQIFNRTGLTHLMVVSGSHITLFAALVSWLTFRIWCVFPNWILRIPAQRAAAFAGWITAFFYCCISGLGIPALRTLGMLTVVVIALFQHRHLRAYQTLTISLLTVMLMDPWCVLAPGFWLSFATVAALLSISELHLEASGNKSLHFILGAFSSQRAATLATAPLLLLFFQELPLVSPIANSIAIPLIGLIVTPLVLLGVFIVELPLGLDQLAYWPLVLADKLVSQLLAFLPYLSHWPRWQTSQPPAWANGLACAGIALVLLPKGVSGRLSLGMMSLLPAFFWPTSKPEDDTFWADVLDVGQGQSVLVRSKNHTLLYDTGPRYGTPGKQGIGTIGTPDAAQRVILPFLRAEGIRQLDRVVVSHRDMDHAGGTETLRQNIVIGSTLSPRVSQNDQDCQSGLYWEWDGVKFQVLHPSASMLDSPPKNTNAVSCVLRITSATQSLLLTGDLPEKEEWELIKQNASLRATVLLSPHHGSKTSSSSAFLAAVQPEHVIISAGYRNRFGHPNTTVLNRYSALNLTVWRTDQAGAIQIRPNNSISGWREKHPHYWY